MHCTEMVIQREPLELVYVLASVILCSKTM